MPIRDNEKFSANFIADTEAEANRLIKLFDTDIEMLSIKRHALTGVDTEDLKQEGLIGLARAKRDFEESRSDNFRIFALYKIKDAMREFITTQASNIKIPQYIGDTIHLIEALKKIMSGASAVNYKSYSEIWGLAENIRVDSKETQQSINKVKTSLSNLAERSHCSVVQLLERAEIMPKLTAETADYVMSSVSDLYDEENNMVKRISSKESVEELKKILEPEELSLLWERFVEGKTLEELEPKLGVTAETIVVRTNNILKKVAKYGNRVLQNETNATAEGAE